MKPFNLEKALAGDPVVTRDGQKVTGIYHFEKSKTGFPVIAHIEGKYGLDSYAINGKWTDGVLPHELDLFMESTEKYFNVYRNGTDVWCGTICDTLEIATEKADNITTGSFVTTLKIDL
jgi:hypothetical protein